MFIPELVPLTKLWNQPKLPLVDELIKKMWYIEYYSATNKNEIMLFVGKWMQLEIIMSSKISQTQKHNCHLFFQMCRI
jgi:hypothetical protein